MTPPLSLWNFSENSSVLVLRPDLLDWRQNVPLQPVMTAMTVRIVDQALTRPLGIINRATINIYHV